MRTVPISVQAVGGLVRGNHEEIVRQRSVPSWGHRNAELLGDLEARLINVGRTLLSNLDAKLS